MFEGSTSE